MTEIERKVVKRGKKNTASRFIRTKGDKGKIAAWKQDLFRVLRVFNVCSILLLRVRQLRGHFQTELAIDTHLVVADTRLMVADMHRNMLTGQEGVSIKNHTVGATYCSTSTERLSLPRLEPGERYHYYGGQSLTF